MCTLSNPGRVLILIFLCFHLTSFSQSFISKHGLSAATLGNEFTKQTNNGYRLISLNTYKNGNSDQFIAHWVKVNGFSQYFHHSLSESDFNNLYNTYLGQGFYLSHISVDYIGGIKRFIGIWDKRINVTVVRKIDMTPSQYQNEFTLQNNNGFRIIHLHSYLLNGQVLYAGVWEKVSGVRFESVIGRQGLTFPFFIQQSDSLAKAGFILRKATGYNLGGVDYYGGLWEKGSYANPNLAIGVDVNNYTSNYDNLRFQGFVPSFISVFNSGTVPKFNSIWNNNHMTANDIFRIDTTINNFLFANNEWSKYKGGLSLAISKQGRLVFAKGYGFANNVTSTPLSPNHPMRVMSISKTLTSVAIFQLIKKYPTKISLDKQVFGTNGILGNALIKNITTKSILDRFYKITVRQLLNHNSGLISCNGEYEFSGSPVFTLDSALTKVLKNPAVFLYEPNTRYLYSNTGFMILHKIIDVLEPTLKYENYVKRNILLQAGIDTTKMYLGQENGQSKTGESEYYPAQYKNMKLYGGFGGWVATPMDLLKYLLRADGIAREPDVIDSSSHSSMLFQDPINKMENQDYAKGWIIGKCSACSPNQRHNGSGVTSSRSWLIKYDSIYSFSYMINYFPSNDDNFYNTLRLKLSDLLVGLKPLQFSGANLFEYPTPISPAANIVGNPSDEKLEPTINRAEGKEKIKIFPNPSPDGKLRIHNAPYVKSITVYDKFGRMEKLKPGNEFITSLKGNLFIRVETDTESYSIPAFVQSP